MSQAMMTLEKFYDVWVLHMEITDRHLMRRGIDVREKTFADAVTEMVFKYFEFVPEDASAQALLELLTAGTNEPPLRATHVASSGQRYAEVEVPHPGLKPEVSMIDEEPDDGLRPADELRAEAEALGINVDGRWGVARLREEIAKAQE